MIMIAGSYMDPAGYILQSKAVPQLPVFPAVSRNCFVFWRRMV